MVVINKKRESTCPSDKILQVFVLQRKFPNIQPT